MTLQEKSLATIELPKILELLAAEAATPPAKELCRQLRPEVILSQCEKQGVDHAVIQSVATTPKQVSSINRFIAKTVEDANGKFTGLGTLHPDGDIAADVKEIIALGLHGVKLHPDIQRF